MLIDFRQLFPKWGIKPSGVLHVGANIGEEAPVYNELGIKEVIWIEGNPNLIEKLQETCRKYGKGYRYHSICASDVTEMVTLHISNNGGQSSSLLELGTHKIAHPDVHYIDDVRVAAIRLDEHFTGVTEETILPKYFNFLNIDVQGAELKVLRGMGNLVDQFKWIYLEVNKDHLYEGCPLVQDIDMFMIGKGFRRVETKWCGNFGWGDALYIR